MSINCLKADCCSSLRLWKWFIILLPASWMSSSIWLLGLLFWSPSGFQLQLGLIQLVFFFYLSRWLCFLQDYMKCFVGGLLIFHQVKVFSLLLYFILVNKNNFLNYNYCLNYLECFCRKPPIYWGTFPDCKLLPKVAIAHMLMCLKSTQSTNFYLCWLFLICSFF